ncbi:MAG TPA: hypothetical protein VNN13_08120, partial [Methylomirabilota bacterium]|nr:hypothetical protein [Methylomirabilota bacterium]
FSKPLLEAVQVLTQWRVELEFPMMSPEQSQSSFPCLRRSLAREFLLMHLRTASKVFIFKANCLTWRRNPLESTAAQTRSGWIGGDFSV